MSNAPDRHPDANAPDRDIGQQWACEGGELWYRLYHTECDACMVTMTAEPLRQILVPHGSTFPADEWTRHPVYVAKLVEVSDEARVMFDAYETLRGAPGEDA